MPPKKKKSLTTTTTGVKAIKGTISTRSSRRDTVLNIKISTKNVKNTKTGASSEKLQKPKEENLQSNNTRPEILEILKDWSEDEDNSQISTDSVILSKNKPNNKVTMNEDQQSLIDILEGRNSDLPLEFQSLDKKSSTTVDNNPIISLDSPKMNEGNDVIEECVIDNDVIVILDDDIVEPPPKSDKISLEAEVAKLEQLKIGNENENSAAINNNPLETVDQCTEKLEKEISALSIEKSPSTEKKSPVKNKTTPNFDKALLGTEMQVLKDESSIKFKTKLRRRSQKMQIIEHDQNDSTASNESQEIKSTNKLKKNNTSSSEIIVIDDNTSDNSSSAVIEIPPTKKSSKLSAEYAKHIDDVIDEVLRTSVVGRINKEQKTPKQRGPKKKAASKLRKETLEEVRRSDRIKTIPLLKRKSHGLVKSKLESNNLEAENSDSNSNLQNDVEKISPLASPALISTTKPTKTNNKAKTAENNLQQVNNNDSSINNSPPEPPPKAIDMHADKTGQSEIEQRLKSFHHLKENLYKTDRQSCKEAKEMECDCFLSEEDIRNDEYGCGDNCLNRLLMIECGELCQVNGRCTNKRFQRSLFAPVEVFKTEKKGLGLRAAANIAYGEFILEYVGEVLDPDEFDRRAEGYSKDKNTHFYFMSLRSDAIIDATNKGNISRFINHSCDPNAETQKWTVNGELRIGFFSTRTILAGEEITFDYRFQRYGKEAQKCFCENANCRGWLGEQPGDSEEDDDEEDEDEEEDEEEEEEEVEEIKEPAVATAKIVAADDENNVIEIKEDKIEIVDITEETQLPVDVDTDAVAKVEEPQEPNNTEIIPKIRKIVRKKKARKETLYEDFDNFNEDVEMLLTTGLKNQAHTLKLSRLMVRATDLEQRKKLLRVLRRGELPCRRLFLDYHGLRLMHGYMIDAQQLLSSKSEQIQAKLELLQTLAVLPIQNKTILIESKVLPAVGKWSKNENIVEDCESKNEKTTPEETGEDPEIQEKVDEIKFLAKKLLEEWVNLKESFRIPKKQRIEQMKEHEKEANRKFMESNLNNSAEKESSSSSSSTLSSRKINDQRYSRSSWSRVKSEREISSKKRSSEGKPSAELINITKLERRKLFALQMELKEEERRMKQREMWRQHEINCMMIGADPRFTAPFDPSKGFQYIWNPSLGQWQALPVPISNSSKTTLITPFPGSILNVPSHHHHHHHPQYSSMIPRMPPPPTSFGNSVHVHHGIPSNSLPQLYQDLKSEDPSQVKFAGPIPPPVKLPLKWKCAKDKYGRPYYYHVKIRKSQWEPPLHQFSEENNSSESSSTESSSETSSSSSSSESDSDNEIDDSKLLLEVRRQVEAKAALKAAASLPPPPSSVVKKEVSTSSVIPISAEIKIESERENEDEATVAIKKEAEIVKAEFSSTEIEDNELPKKKQRREGLCQEIIISPRSEEDRLKAREDTKRYKATKEKLKRQKEQLRDSSHTKKKPKRTAEETAVATETPIILPQLVLPLKKRVSKNTAKSQMKEMKEWNDEHSKKIKEVFRSNMATTVVSVLNVFRKPECKEARITNTEDFKHLARKLTHFVMLKEMKHLTGIDDLVCTDNVKAKAREYIKKYMSKFGETYHKRPDEPDFKD